jgi:tRNA(Ile)-lysidine synthase
MPSQVEQVFSALTGPSGRTFSSATHDAVVDRGRLLVEEHREPLPVLRIPEEGTYRYADSGKLRVSVSREVHVSKEAFRATLDADKVLFPLTLRPVQTGDRFQPFGMQGSRLVSDFLTDRKCSLIDKKRQLVVTDREGCIVWLVGMRTDQRFAVESSTNHVLIVSYDVTNSGNT